MVLLRNICGLVPPVRGWDALPFAADTTLEADIARIKFYRNTVYSRASEASVDDESFNMYWREIQDALVRLGGADYQGAIENLRNESLDPDLEEKHKELLEQNLKHEHTIKESLDELYQTRQELHDLKESSPEMWVF